jgi:hypothetical protein
MSKETFSQKQKKNFHIFHKWWTFTRCWFLRNDRSLQILSATFCIQLCICFTFTGVHKCERYQTNYERNRSDHPNESAIDPSYIELFVLFRCLKLHINIPLGSCSRRVLWHAWVWHVIPLFGHLMIDWVVSPSVQLGASLYNSDPWRMSCHLKAARVLCKWIINTLFKNTGIRALLK